MNGSPPRAWGRPACCVERVEVVRFTPTCVGTTHRARDRRRAHRFTPTCVGTTPAPSATRRPMIGSPPRAWGRPDLERLSEERRSVHPHVRGDDDYDRSVAGLDSGSPPRAWGRRGHCRTDRASSGSPPRAWGRRGTRSWPAPLLRFTPTCVGTTWSIPRTRAAAAVHPHVRGDDPPPSTKVGETHGSPPRAWGRLRGRGLGQDPRRFTPTCVGTTRVATALSPQHPGSPPRAWGRLDILPGVVPFGRFTPTCVGTTLSIESVPAVMSVHPHVRGDDVDGPADEIRDPGSPPRAWGRRDHILVHGVFIRFTPTCVGTTVFRQTTAASCAVHPHVRGDDSLVVTCVCRPPVHPHVRGDDRDMDAAEAALFGSPPRAWGRLW